MLRRTFVAVLIAASWAREAMPHVRAQSTPAPATPATPVSPATPTATHDFTLTRTFAAPVEQVWRAWSEPELVKQWWGPAGWSAPVAEIDFREGGTTLVAMRSPEGQEIYNTWTYQTIVPMERIEFISRFADREGNPLDPAALGLPPGIPPEVPHVVTFTALGENETELSITESGYGSAEIAELSRMGQEQVMDKMEAVLTADE